MKQNETYDGEKMYWLTCDHCGDFTLQYESETELAANALDAGWRYNSLLNKHFCCLTCEVEGLVDSVGKEKGGLHD